MNALLFIGMVAAWLGTFFGLDGIHTGWITVAEANLAAMGWAAIWLSIVMLADI